MYNRNKSIQELASNSIKNIDGMSRIMYADNTSIPQQKFTNSTTAIEGAQPDTYGKLRHLKEEITLQLKT